MRNVSYHFVRDGKLPADTAARIQDVHEERQAADYNLASYPPAEASARLDDVEALIDRLDALA